MTAEFGKEYCELYDALYHDKDYERECNIIEQVFADHANRSVCSVLDMGCGTGGHAIPLVKRGYDVTGIDRSGDLLARARRKAKEGLGSKPFSFHRADIRKLDLGRRFDAAIMMFAVLGYQGNNEHVLAALRSTRKHLDSGGLFLFDVWYGPAVLRQRPSARIKQIDVGRARIVRFATADLNVYRHLCSVHYTLWQVEERRLVSEAKETHRMRYFFPMELELFLEVSGFSLLELRPFPDIARKPDETTWNVLAVTRAK